MLHQSGDCKRGIAAGDGPRPVGRDEPDAVVAGAPRVQQRDRERVLPARELRAQLAQPGRGGEQLEVDHRQDRVEERLLGLPCTDRAMEQVVREARRHEREVLQRGTAR